MRGSRKGRVLAVLGMVTLAVVVVWLGRGYLRGGKPGWKTGESTRRGILIVGNGVEPKGLDPHTVTGVAEGKILAALFEGLARPHAAQDGTALPGMAREWEVSPDGKVWTFHLRDAVWTDGAPVTAGDFVYAWHRMLHPGFGAKYASMLYPLVNARDYNRKNCGLILARELAEFGAQPEVWASLPWPAINALSAEALRDELARIETGQPGSGAIPWPEELAVESRRALLRKLAEYRQAGSPDLWDRARVGVSAPDGKTLVVRLESPIPNFPLMTSHHAWFPVPERAIEAGGGMLRRGNPWCRPGAIVSNGPFRLKFWRVNDRIELEANPGYWDAGKVGLRGIRFLPVVNGFTETRMFLAGMMHMTNNVPAEMIPYARNEARSKFAEGVFRQEAYFSNAFYRLNTARPALSDPDIRKALSLALDRGRLVERVMNGSGQPCDGFVPPLPGYAPAGGTGHDPETARRLLAQAGYPGGKGFPRLTILISTREVMKSMAEAIQAMWKSELGINVEIQAREWTAYLQARERQEFDILASSWSGDYLDPATFLELWRSGDGNNATGWANRDYDELLARARDSADPATRGELMRQAERLMLAEMPVIPLFWARRSYLVAPEVRGYSPLLLDNHPWQDIRLEPADAEHVGKQDPPEEHARK